MTSDATYDMKKKLLDIKSELLKSTNSQQQTAERCTEAPKASNADEMVCLLRELNLNQQKIIELLSEINSKLV